MYIVRGLRIGMNSHKSFRSIRAPMGHDMGGSDDVAAIAIFLPSFLPFLHCFWISGSLPLPSSMSRPLTSSLAVSSSSFHRLSMFWWRSNVFTAITASRKMKVDKTVNTLPLPLSLSPLSLSPLLLCDLLTQCYLTRQNSIELLEKVLSNNFSY